MPIPNDLSPAVRKTLVGTPFGEVYPERKNPPPIAYDGRTVALRTLRAYLSEITFRRSGGRNARGEALTPIDFRIAPENIQIGWPDYEKAMVYPSLTFLHNPGKYEAIGLTAHVEEDSRDRYAPGTAIMWMSEYVETFQIEIWANKRAELRAVLAGIETSLTPTEQMYGIRFRMPEYFDQLVRFTPGTRQEFDEQDSARGRRRARLDVEMSFHVVALINYELLLPEIRVVTDVDPDYGQAVTDEELAPSRPTDMGPCDPCG